MTTDRHLTDDQLQDFVDGNIGPDFAVLTDHLDHCPQCRAAVADYRALCSGLTEEFGMELSPTFAASVAARAVSGQSTSVTISPAVAAETSPAAVPTAESGASRDWTPACIILGIAAVVASAVYFFGTGGLASVSSILGVMQFNVIDTTLTTLQTFLARYDLSATHALLPVATFLFYLAVDGLIGTVKRRGHIMLSV